jgi:arylsulfatase A-like enzyme
MREPCIMRWPGEVPAGSVCGELATIMDLLPTVAKLAGTEAPKDRVIDGKDIWPLMAGQAGAKTPHEAFFYHTSQGQLAAVRSGKWKLHLRPPRRRRRRKKGEPAPKPQPPTPQLYDLAADVGEKTNVADKHPEIVQRLTGLLRRFDEELKANLRPPGTV